MATQDPVRFAARVGVAPSTTTMQLGAAQSRPRFYMPYASLEDLRAAHGGLGIVNESDAWLTGRPYGLPGTATLRLTQHQGGYQNPQGYHYDASMVGGGFGDADTANVALQLQSILQQQQAQAASLKRMAFWQTALGVATVVSLAAGAAVAIGGVISDRRRR